MLDEEKETRGAKKDLAKALAEYTNSDNIEAEGLEGPKVDTIFTKAIK